MKFIEPRPFADPDAAARKLVEIANGIETVQDGRIYIELINEQFLKAGGSEISTARRSIVRSRRGGSNGTRAAHT
jgi:hypothetical protein